MTNTSESRADLIFTTKKPEEGEIEAAIHSQFNVSKQKDDERAMLQRMKGNNEQRIDNKGLKNIGTDITGNLKREY